MNYRIFTLLLSILFLNTLSFAQPKFEQDDAKAVVADPVDFEKAKFSYYSVGGKKWIKASIKARCKGDPDAKTAGTDPEWLKNIEINFVCAFEGSKKQMLWFSAPVKFYALERNKDYYLTFYVPWEFVDMNDLRYDPTGYLIELKANSKDYPLNAKNFTRRSNLTTKNVKSFMDAADSNASENQGVMVYIDDAPVIIQYNDTPSGVIPTSIKKK